MMLWEEAEKTALLGMEIYSFGLYCALGALLSLVMLLLLCQREKMKKGTAPLMALCMMAGAMILSRLFFSLLDRSLGAMIPFKWALNLTTGGYSMVGALLGGALGAALAGKISGQKPLRLAEIALPALLLFVACERLGEGTQLEFGVSRPLLGDALKGSFLSVEGDYDWYLATYLLESFAAVILALVLLRDLSMKRRAGDTVLLALILYGASQTVLESLRYDRHLSFSFVGAQHIAALLMLGTAVIILAVRKLKTNKKLALAAIVSIPLAAGLGVGLEFAIDRTEINRYLLYLIYILLIAAPAWMGVRLRKEGK